MLTLEQLYQLNFVDLYFSGLTKQTMNQNLIHFGVWSSHAAQLIQATLVSD